MEGKELGLAAIVQSLLGLLISAYIVMELWSPQHCTETEAAGVSARELVQLRPTRCVSKSFLQGTVHP